MVLRACTAAGRCRVSTKRRRSRPILSVGRCTRQAAHCRKPEIRRIEHGAEDRSAGVRGTADLDCCQHGRTWRFAHYKHDVDEDDIVLDAFRKLSAEFTELLLILAPRQP